VTGRWRALVLVVLLGAPMAACSDDGPGDGEARLEVDGEALVERADGDEETVDDDTDLDEGDRVTVTNGVAVMRLSGGTTFELRKGLGDAAADTSVLMAQRPVLEAGDLLVTTPDTAKLEADGTEVDVVEGAARVTRAFGMSVSAYDADVGLDSAGVAAEVPALRRIAVPELGRPPRRVNPVDYDVQDPWDRRHLGAWMDVGADLERLSQDLTGRLPDGGGRTAAFYRLVLPGLEDEREFPDRFTPDREPGETLIGAAITDLGEKGTFGDRWEAVFDFRDAGAEWGIVAYDQAVDADPLRGSVEEAFNASFDEVAQGPGPVAPPTGGTDGGTDGGADGGTDGGTDGTDGSPPTTDPTPPPTSPPVTTPPVTPPTTPEPPPELNPVVDPVVAIVEDLLGGLLP
jgi:hypothetical protein